MDSSNVIDLSVLKTLPHTIQTSNHNERKTLFEELDNVLIYSKLLNETNEGMCFGGQLIHTICITCKLTKPLPTASILRGVFKVLLLTIDRYNSNKSRRLVIGLIRKLLKKYPNASQHLVTAVHACLIEFKPTGLFVSRKCLTLLKWLCLIEHVDRLEANGPSRQLLLKCHAIILSTISEIGYRPHHQTMKRYLNAFIQASFPIDLYLEELVALSVDAETAVFTFNLWEFLLEKLTTTQAEDLIKRHKARPAELLSKFIICSKVKVPKDKFYKYSHFAIQGVEIDQFRNEVLPAIQKAVLRSAETALPVIDYLIENLAIDLSEFAQPLSKLITGQLIGKESSLRELSVNCFRNLAVKSDQNSILAVAQNLAEVYNGSGGKLTLPEQKFGVLCAIGRLSETNSLDDKLIEMVCGNLIGFMKTEIHEPTLIEILAQTAKWSSRLSAAPTPAFLEQIKSVFSLKSVTPMVKAMNYSLLKCIVNSHSIGQLKEFSSFVSASITKGLSSNLSQHQLISEALFASNFVLKLAILDANHANGQVIQQLAKLDKLPFLSDKYLAVCSKECYTELLEFIGLLFKSKCFEKEIEEHEQIVFATLVHLLNFRHDYQVRSAAADVFRELFAGSTNRLVKMIISCFLQLCSSLEAEGLDDSADQKRPSANMLVQCIKVISSIRPPFDEKKEIDFSAYGHLLDLFTACHIPSVYSAKSFLWLKLLNHNLGVQNVQNFIEQNLHNLVNLSYAGHSSPKVQENCIKTLINFFPEQFLPVFTKNINACLRNEAFRSVSKVEYAIFRTPEGELYDVSVIGANAEEFNTKNLKKENKLYSYKEQLEEIKFRQELSKKKSAELTKKQQEAKSVQLQKESEIRRRIAGINQEFEISLLRLNTIIEGNPLFTSFYLKDLIPSLICLFPSPLCASQSTKAYLNLSRCVLDKRSTINYMVKAIAYATLRQFEPNCEIDPDWTIFDLAGVEASLLDQLHDQVCQSNQPTVGNDEINESMTLDDQSKLLKPTTFAYIFPFISNLLIKRKRLDDSFDKLLSIILQHVTIEFDDEIEELEDLAKNPIYLPRKDLCQLLLTIMDQKSIVVAKKANKVFAQLGRSIANWPDNEETLNEIHTLVLDSLNSANDLIRIACLEALNDQIDLLAGKQAPSELYNKLYKSIWIAQFDSNSECETKATEFWLNFKMNVTPELCSLLLDDILIYKFELLEAVSSSVGELLSEFPDQAKYIFDRLSTIYKEIAPESIPTVDEFGRPLNRKIEDNYVPRFGIALVLTKSASYFPDDIRTSVAKFLVYVALRDVNDRVRKQMLATGIALINKTAKENLHQLLQIFQKYLEEADNSKETDAVRASVVVLTGTLASRLDKTDPYIKQIIVKLIETLSTPSQMVQESVAFCLPGLVPSIKDDLPTLIENLFKLLLDSDDYGQKKGAAYGIAGFVKGLGILSIKELGIISKCKKAIAHKKPSRKIGALIAYEVFCNVLGKVFEPYVIKLIPNLFVCFGDASENVRKTTYETAKTIMNNLSVYGVKFILPALLDALNQENWRTKVGSVELLGAMAYCAPKQLSSCLPTIVPKLMALVCDSHASVQKAANDALKEIGQVIGNPEVQEIVPVLLSALDDPANKTQKCLETMLTTQFVHFIDAPSLALIMPVIERAFQARSTKTRKSAAQIIGNLYSLTDQNDLRPYLAAIIPGLKQSLLDPVPGKLNFFLCFIL